MLHFLIKIFIPFILPLCAIHFYFAGEAIANTYFTRSDQIDRSTKNVEKTSGNNSNIRNKENSKKINNIENGGTLTEFSAITDKINSRINVESAEFNEIITKVKETEEKRIKTDKASLESIINASKSNLNNLSNQESEEVHSFETAETNVTVKMLNDYKELDQSLKKQTSCKAGIQEAFKIFVSFSMPKELIKNYDEIARKIGAKLIIKGLINNNFKDTINYIKELNDQGMVIDIDPRPFDEFKIDLVPSFVLSDSKAYDKLVGSVSAIYALEQFADSGETSIKAKEYLSKLSSKIVEGEEIKR